MPIYFQVLCNQKIDRKNKAIIICDIFYNKQNDKCDVFIPQNIINLYHLKLFTNLLLQVVRVCCRFLDYIHYRFHPSRKTQYLSSSIPTNISNGLVFIENLFSNYLYQCFSRIYDILHYVRHTCTSKFAGIRLCLTLNL